MPNLVYALIWLAAAVGLLLWQALHPENPGLVIRGTGVSFGWLALALAIYNLVCWWSSWSYQRQRRELAEEHGDRQQSARPQPPGQTAPNPDFDFSDKPPES
jgi:hypothetical protein